MNERDETHPSTKEQIKRNATEAPMGIILADFTDLNDPTLKRYHFHRVPGLAQIDPVEEKSAPEDHTQN